jgi:hypothetical protein
MLGKRNRDKDGSLTVKNILSHKLIEIRDFPTTQKIGSYCVGSLLGEEDVFAKEETY